MSHFIYTREGAAQALGLRNVSGLSYYIKKAKAAGEEPSKIIGGVEYFDLDILENAPVDNYFNNIKMFIKKQMENRKNTKKHLQLKLFDLTE